MTLKRRILFLLLPLALLLSAAALAADDPTRSAPAEPGQTALLPLSRTYDGRFADVPGDAWYYAHVAAGYERGLFEGRDEAHFAPGEPVRVSELVTLAARIRAAYDGETIPAGAEDEPWYRPYAAYLSEKGLLGAALAELCDQNATRAMLAGVFAMALPEECYDARNAQVVTDGYAMRRFIRDVNDYTPYQAQILWLYKQGVLNGMDEAGSFAPGGETTRAEVAAVVTRIVDPAARLTLAWNVQPYDSAAGRTLASLIPAPEAAPEAPDPADAEAVDAAVRAMLADDGDSLTLRYPAALDAQRLGALTRACLERVKTYAEQMYNTVQATAYPDGTTVLAFSSSAGGEALTERRAQAAERAAAVHDTLWEQGMLYNGMTEYEKAWVYFVWLCQNCAYDHGAGDDSPSHLAWRALQEGLAVCDGYTGAYNLLLKLEGIACSAVSNDEHMWTLAVLDGVAYHIDTTWGDRLGMIDASCFGMSEEEAFALHAW